MEIKITKNNVFWILILLLLAPLSLSAQSRMKKYVTYKDMYTAKDGFHILEKNLEKDSVLAFESELDSLLNLLGNLKRTGIEGDYEEIELAYFFIDSTKGLPDSLKSVTVSKETRVAWVANKREIHGDPRAENALRNELQTAMTIKGSPNNLFLVIEKPIYQLPDLAWRRWHAREDAAFNIFYFKNREDYESFTANFLGKYVRRIKSAEHNTIYSADAQDGNDGTDCSSGCDWPGEATLGAIDGDNPTGSDTVQIVGNFTEIWQPDDDGSSGNQIFVFDSLSVTNGINLTNPDTTNLWSATIDGGAARASGVVLSNDNYWRFHGIEFIESTGGQVRIINNTTGSTFIQCRIRQHGDGTGFQVDFSPLAGGTADSLISCVIIGDTTTGNAIFMNLDGTGVMLNNSIYGNFNSTAAIVNSGSAGTLEFTNNAIHNLATGSIHAVFVASNSLTSVDDWNYNDYYADGATNTFEFNTANFDLIATWIDSSNNYTSAGHEANSINSDPNFQGVGTTLFIDTDSNLFNAAENNSFNDASNPSIGFYQPVAAAGRKRVIFFSDLKREEYFTLVSDEPHWVSIGIVGAADSVRTPWVRIVEQ
jgi:hypothetical protein